MKQYLHIFMFSKFKNEKSMTNVEVLKNLGKDTFYSFYKFFQKIYFNSRKRGGGGPAQC